MLGLVELVQLFPHLVQKHWYFPFGGGSSSSEYVIAADPHFELEHLLGLDEVVQVLPQWAQRQWYVFFLATDLLSSASLIPLPP
ncbi:MAG TPA: hypothetical protein VGM19_04780 [Armatimonadota bacterium]